MKWTSLCVSQYSLRGICFRTKTSKRGAPFAFVSFGPHSNSESIGLNWLGRWIQLLDDVWHDLRTRCTRFGQEITPDCLFFCYEAGQFAPASYAQTLSRLRQLLELSGLTPAESNAYTLHSMKSTLLSWMAQLEIPLTSRFLQGHHQVPGSAQLYSRDEIWPALRAQIQLWKAIHLGFLPMLPQHRGGQLPVQEPSPRTQGFVLRELHLQLRCFKVNDDARTFLSWRSEEASLALSPEVTAAVGQVPSPLHPAPNFEDSDAEQPASYAAPPLSESSVEAVPTWSEEGTAPGPVCTASPEHSMTPSLVCTATRFLISASGIVHTAVKHTGSKMTCLACGSPACENRLYPACGCIVAVKPAETAPVAARFCRRRACILTGPETT